MPVRWRAECLRRPYGQFFKIDLRQQRQRQPFGVDGVRLRLRPVADTTDTRSGERQIGGHAQAVRDGGTRRGADLRENIGGKGRP